MNKKVLKEIFDIFELNKEQAKIVEGLVDGTIAPIDVSKTAEVKERAIIAFTHNELVMEALSEVLGADWEYMEEYNINYLVTGDAYTPSLIFNESCTELTVSSYGDYIEDILSGKEFEFVSPISQTYRPQDLSQSLSI